MSGQAVLLSVTLLLLPITSPMLSATILPTNLQLRSRTSPVSQTKREFDTSQLMQFKCGFDALSGEVLGMGVSGDPGNSTGGQQTITFIEVVETVEDFIKYLNVSASASVQVAFGHGGPRQPGRRPSLYTIIPSTWLSTSR